MLNKITSLLCFAAGNLTTFREEGLANVSTLLVDKETNTLFVGGRDAVFALDLNDISREIARVNERSFFFIPSLKRNTFLVDFFRRT